jgi:molybdopterin-guanine dinucleotide biosynthesis protein MobB
MVPVVSIVGCSGCGKTTLICQMLPVLAARGRRVAVIKHHHEDFEIDHEGKDSFRFAAAGAATVMVASPTKTAMIRRGEPEPALDELIASFAPDVDLVITEGFKLAHAPKIEVWRQSQPDPTIVCRGDPTWIALVADFPHDVDVPVLDLNSPEQVVDFIENRVMKKSPRRKTQLLVNGRRIPLNAYVADMLAGVARGAVSTLKGGEEPRRILLRIDE